MKDAYVLIDKLSEELDGKKFVTSLKLKMMTSIHGNSFQICQVPLRCAHQHMCMTLLEWGGMMLKLPNQDLKMRMNCQ